MRKIRYQSLPTISYVAGRAPTVDLLRGVKTHALGFRAEGQVTITGAAAGAVNAEGVQRLIDRVKIIENGNTTIEVTGRFLGYLTGRSMRQTPNFVQLSAATAAVYQISGDFVMDFASIYGADPSEVAYVERNSQAPTVIEVTFNSTPATALTTVGTGVVLDSFRLTPFQMFDPVTSNPPAFLPRITPHTSQGITGTLTRFAIPLLPEAGSRVESVVLHSISDNVSVATILNGNVTLRDDKTKYIEDVHRLSVLNEMRRFSTQPAVSLSYLEMPSRLYGKLSEMYITGQGDNFRVEVDVAHPGTTDLIDAYVIGRVTVPGLTAAIPEGW